MRFRFRMHLRLGHPCEVGSRLAHGAEACRKILLGRLRCLCLPRHRFAMPRRSTNPIRELKQLNLMQNDLKHQLRYLATLGQLLRILGRQSTAEVRVVGLLTRQWPKVRKPSPFALRFCGLKRARRVLGETRMGSLQRAVPCRSRVQQ